MGLLQTLRRWLFGSPNGRPPDSRPEDSRPDIADAPASPQASAAKRRSTAPPKLQPLRYRSSLVRTPVHREVSVSSEPPYRFALRDAFGRGYLDLSTDADARWLDYYGLPHLSTPEHLAHWLQIPVGKLAWLTNRFAENQRPQTVREAHYHFHWLKKKSGGRRLIEAPKSLLKQVQEQILYEILERVPAHPDAHGFVVGRSIRTNAEPHLGQRFVLKLDLEDFYANCRYSRITAIFRSLGFSREAALWLARLTTSAAPTSMPFPDGDVRALQPYIPRHLPQGAPTSPALANLSAYSIDVRLSGLAQKYHLTYTRYADDLTFSGDGHAIPALRDFIPLATKILRQERFRVNRHKRKIIRSNRRQIVTGVVVNVRTNVSRPDYERLKAVLHNCVKHGPSTQNRAAHPAFAAHLRGRIAHVMHLNEPRGRKLLAVFERIDWKR